MVQNELKAEMFCYVVKDIRIMITETRSFPTKPILIAKLGKLPVQEKKFDNLAKMTINYYLIDFQYLKCDLWV